MMAMTDPVTGVIACVDSRDVATGEWMQGRFVMMVISTTQTPAYRVVVWRVVVMVFSRQVLKSATMET